MFALNMFSSPLMVYIIFVIIVFSYFFFLLLFFWGVLLSIFSCVVFNGEVAGTAFGELLTRPNCLCQNHSFVDS
jgi:hypothetical protein